MLVRIAVSTPRRNFPVYTSYFYPYNGVEVIVLTLTEKLDVLLEERSLNKAQLSAQSGLPYTTIVSLYEKGAQNAKRSTLLTLARFFKEPLIKEPICI